MLIETLLDTPLHVQYGFFALQTADEAAGDHEDAFRGQANGLCGSAVPGRLQMHSGLHTGLIQVRVELHTAEPELDDGWPDVVETVFAQPAGDTWLTAFDSSEGPVDLPPGMYRVRYCARDMQRGHDLGTGIDEEPVGLYRLQFWPAAGLDRVVRQGSEIAAQWHRDGPEPAWTSTELSGRVATARTRRSEQEAYERELDIEQTWGGHPPDDPQVRDAGWGAARLWEIDPTLVMGLANADDRLRREVTAWAAERLLDRAGLLVHDWAGRMVAALRDGTELPDRFEVSQDLPPMPIAPGIDDHAAAQHLATEAVFNAGIDPDTLGGACDAVCAVADQDDPADVVARVRAAFPQLA